MKRNVPAESRTDRPPQTAWASDVGRRRTVSGGGSPSQMHAAGSSHQLSRPREQSSQVVRMDPASWHAGLGGRLHRAYEREVARGLRLLLLALGFGGLLAMLLPISGAVVIAGTLISGGNAKKVQHPTGGVIDRILVEDGQSVQRGDVLLKLSEVAARSSLKVVEQQLDEARARVARLSAERDDLSKPSWPVELTQRADDARVAALMNAEQTEFDARQTAYGKQIEILKRRALQLAQEQAGYRSQATANEKQKKYVSLELDGLEKLYKEQLVPLSRLSAVAREAARLEGERGQLQSAIAQHDLKIEEANLQISAAVQSHRVELAQQLTEAKSKQSELLERRAVAKDVADHVEIRAPVAGIVHQLSAHTIGGVVAPGEVVMLIEPDGDELAIEARLPPNEVDQVSLRQPATVRLSALDRSTTPQIAGTVSYVSPDVVHDSQTNSAYYSVKIILAPGAHQHNIKLRPGMPAEIFLETGSRTIMSYLLKPLSDQARRAMRER